jgi:ribonuclease HII
LNLCFPFGEQANPDSVFRGGPSTVLRAGVDEAGRGPLAGPVCAAAVILDPGCLIPGIQDSKKLSACQRARLAESIRRLSLSWAVAWASVEEIDRLNILQASLLAMQRAVAALCVAPGEVWVDGNQCPKLPCPVQAVVGGDAKVPAISAASILAKTARDAEMMRLHSLYPQYGLDEHKGYPTQSHLRALRVHGVSCIHRKSFRPVRQLVGAGT